VISPWAILFLGFILGMEHASDADHVVAVSTMVNRSRRLLSAARVGVMWGLGHTFAILLAGLAILLLKLSIPYKVAQGAEFTVGIVLVILGALVLRDVARARQWRLHRHPHDHPREEHRHLHIHTEAEVHRHRHGLRPFLIGIVHGLAGSAALTLLVLSTIDSTLWGIVYILVFGLGSILGMMFFSGIIGLPFVLTSGNRFARFQSGIKLAAGVLSMGLGVGIMLQIGMGQGLLT
jgi:ABC-type nickel/cobalt efflux system permease component RcnA